MTLRACRLLLIPVAVILALAGCTPTAPRPTETPAALPTNASSSPIPTSTADAVPAVRIPLACGALLDPATVSTLVGVSATLKQDETSTPGDIAEIANRQFGTLTCVWGGTNMTDSGYDQTVDLSIAPDSADAYAKYAGDLASERGMTILNTVGSQSAYGCQSYKQPPGRSFYCDATMLVGTFWFSARIAGDGPLSLTQATVTARVQGILDRIAVAISAGNPTSAWTAPDPTFTAGFCDATSATARVREAWHTPDLATANLTDDPGYYDASNIAQADAGYSLCDWQRSGSSVNPARTDYVDVQILAGASWAFPALVASPPSPPYLARFAVVDVPGADHALMACHAELCDALLQLGTVGVEIGFSDIGRTAAVANLAATVKAISG